MGLPFGRDKEKTVKPPEASDPNVAVQASKEAEKEQKSIFRLPFGKKDAKPAAEPAPETPPSAH
jgi:outer membrane protein assembly factor BamD